LNWMQALTVQPKVQPLQVTINDDDVLTALPARTLTAP